MKRVALLAALMVVGCDVAPLETMRKAAPPTTTTSWTFDSNAWTVAKASCIQCHQSAPYPAGIEIHPISGGGQLVGSMSLNNIFDGVAYEKAPAHKRLLTPDKSYFLTWLADQGATWHNPSVPATLSWSMATQIGSASDGTSAAAPGKFFGFRVEDLARLDSQTFIINTYTDRNGVSKKCIEFSETASVNPDSFPSSSNPTSYIFIDGLAWTGRMRTVEAHGYVVQSRWLFIGFTTMEMKKGASPNAAREQRDYVRLQIDRDWVSWRGKKIPADGVETYPWSGADPYLTAGSEGLNDGVFLNDDEYYRVDVSITDLGSTLKYYATVKTVGGTLKAEVAGTRSDTGSPHGSIFFGSYSTNTNTSKRDRFAEWEVTATLYGAGNESCRDCYYVVDP